MKASIRPSGEIAGATAASVKLVSAVGTISRPRDGVRYHAKTPATVIAPAPMPATTYELYDHLERAAGDDCSAWSISLSASAMLPSRCDESFSRHCRSRRAIPSDRVEGSCSQDGSRSRMAAIVPETVSPPKGARPTSIAHRTQPNAQMSVRLSTGWPRACSGLMNDAVPTTPCVPPSAVEEAAPAASGSSTIDFARPKSSTFTVPSRVIPMLAGFRSRWTMPLLCAASSASAICRAMVRD